MKTGAVLERDKQLDTPLHLFVVLSMMAFVDTILPYLEEKKTDKVLLAGLHTSQCWLKNTQRRGVEQLSMTSL